MLPIVILRGRKPKKNLGLRRSNFSGGESLELLRRKTPAVTTPSQGADDRSVVRDRDSHLELLRRNEPNGWHTVKREGNAHLHTDRLRSRTNHR